jgi:environmental stress-induced protein Ves
MPWKNGQGLTQEIAIYPENADSTKDDFLWRVSMAKIAHSSDFSIFPEYERDLILLGDASLNLKLTSPSPHTLLLQPLEPFHFSGAQAIRGELVDGVCWDLSLFARRNQISITTSICNLKKDEPFKWIAQGRWSFVLVGVGEVEIIQHANFRPVHTLGQFECARVDEAGTSENFLLSSRISESKVILFSIYESLNALR